MSAALTPLAFIFCLALAIPGAAQDQPEKKPRAATKPAVKSSAPKSIELKADAINARIDLVEQSKDLDDAAKTKALGLYYHVHDHLKAADDWTAASAQFDKDKADAPPELESLKAELAKPPDETHAEAPADAALAQLEQSLSKAEADLADAQNALAQLDAEPRRRSDRRVEIPKLVSAARAVIDESAKELAAAAPKDEPPEMTLARRTVAQARKRASELEIAAYEKELSAYDAQAELVPARRDAAARRLAQADRLAQEWRALVSDRRRKEAEADLARAEEAQRKSLRADPAIRDFVRQITEATADLANERSAPAEAEKPGVAARIERYGNQLAAINAQLSRIGEEFKSVTGRVEAAGMTKAVGLLLRNQRAKLPNLRKLRRDVAARQEEVSEVELRRIELEEIRKASPDVETQVQSVLSGLDDSIDVSQKRVMEGELRDLIQSRRKLLDGLINDYGSLSAALDSLDSKERALIQEAQEFSAYINENILWIRSAPGLRLSELAPAWSSLAWLGDPNGWLEVADALWAGVARNPVLYLASLLLLLAWTSRQRELRHELLANGETAAHKRGDTMIQTLHALLLTALIAELWPSVLAFCAWRLTVASEGSDFARSLGSGLTAGALCFATGEFIRQLCRPLGVGEAHFGWSAAAMKAPRRNLAWFMAVTVPMIAAIAMIEWRDNGAWKDPLGRVAFLGVMAALAVLLSKLFRPTGGILEEYLSRHPGSWPDRLRILWFALAIALPTGFGITAAVGYHFTAAALAWRLAVTAWFLMGLLIANAYIARWLLIARRRLAIEQARKRIAAMKAAAKESSDASGDTGGIAVTAEAEVDLAAVSKQTSTLLRTSAAITLLVGLWLIWVDVLPALNILDRVHLWDSTVKTTQIIPIAQPGSVVGVVGPPAALAATPEQKLVPITLADLLLAVIVMILTYIGGSNLPGLMEISILQRLPLDSGSRYAVKMITTYLISLIGVVMAFGMVGIGWTDVQWLAAAITVGLGFGLQEIFANFVSGMIILFERPIRVGDVVTVGDVTGTVARIQMRSTRISDGENRDLIVPNKDLITGRVINWTLTDTITRLVISIGVPHSSDTALVERLLLEAARGNPLVLAQPEPRAVFAAFGSSSLEFKLYASFQRRENGHKLLNDLNTAIDQAFRKAGIQIALPQMDLHVRTIQGGLPPASSSGTPIP